MSYHPKTHQKVNVLLFPFQFKFKIFFPDESTMIDSCVDAINSDMNSNPHPFPPISHLCSFRNETCADLALTVKRECFELIKVK